MKKFILFLSICCSLSAIAYSQTFDQLLANRGMVLVSPMEPIANYVNVVRVGNLLYLSGKGPVKSDGTEIKGKVGKDITTAEGYEAARNIAVQHLSIIKAELGNLEEVKRIVKVFGMVNCSSKFFEQSKVINGYSDLMVEIFGEKGKHARSAVGVYALPNNVAVEIEVIVELAPIQTTRNPSLWWIENFWK